MEKLKLDLDSVRVDSFITSETAAGARGSVQAHAISGVPCNLLTYNSCPTQYCTPPTAFAEAG